MIVKRRMKGMVGWIAVVVALSALSAAVFGTAAALTVPLCGEVLGFAGVKDNVFQVHTLGLTVDPGESVVLSVYSYPMEFGNANDFGVYFQASFRQTSGVGVSTTSDGNGLLQVRNIMPNSFIYVDVLSKNPDTVMPFRFFSYHANFPSCCIAVSPTSRFVGQVENDASVCFKATPPSATSTDLQVTSDGLDVFHVSSLMHTQGLDAKSGDILRWNSSDAYITFFPQRGASNYTLLSVAVEWYSRDGNDSLAPANPQPRPGEAAPTTSPVTTTATPGSATASKPRHSVNIFLVIFLVVASYFALATFANYKLHNITTFPDMVPHVERMRAFRDFLSDLGGSMRNSGRNGYSELDRHGDVHTGQI